MKATYPVYDSDQTHLAILEDLIELVRYRDLLTSLVQRDLTVRYKRSVLGFLWTMLNPLLIMLVMTIVFSTFFQFAIEHYPVYLLSGFLLWNFFSQSTTQASYNLVWAGGLINKIYIPKSVFTVSPILLGLVNLLLSLLPLVAIMLLTGHPLSLALLFLPISILLAAIFALGVAFFISTLAIFFADVVDIYQVGLTVLMYLTPLFYPVDIVPAKFLFFLQINPMFYFVEVFRQPIYQGSLPEWHILVTAAIIAFSTLITGWWFFTSKSNEFAYRV